ncbi:MAG: NAD+ synthase [Spirochaetaceae bacterium]|jgi:NAD+ synthase (glutamine-hydrolysing)|nr:NAD+ synthase [Spirochaetaceae bacterium]
MRISIAQINSIIGDFRGNVDRILRFTKRAAEEHGADLVLFPELAVCGYPPMDLLDQDRFVELGALSVHVLQRELPHDIAVGVGFVGRNPYAGGKALVNEYGIILNGKLVFEQIKTLLPTYDVFDEARNFERAQAWSAFEYKDERIGIAICEDVWRETATPGTYYVDDPVRALLNQGISLLCVPSASPYYARKMRTRKALAERICRRGDLPIVYINAVGANDSIIFDGRSFIVAPAGRQKGGDPEPVMALMAKGFEEDLVGWDTAAGTVVATAGVADAGIPGDATPGAAARDEADLFGVGLSRFELDTLENALVLGIREYMEKCGFSRAHLGLSGGIDSALVAYLGVRAVGKDRIAAFSMPSRFSSQGSKDDAAGLARNLGCSYSVLPIEAVFTSFLDTLKDTFEGRPFDLAEENLQARIRGALMMAYSNKFGSMLLTTGNKSELAMGYCTLYGDMCGALAPIGDLFKTEVFALCRRINERSRAAGNGSVIPDAILTKPPSAELRPNQKDQDSLPPYEDLDQILKLYLFENLSKQEITERGWDSNLVGGIIKTAARAEFKRRQAPPVLKVSPRAFGMGRRMPIARTVHEI